MSTEATPGQDEATGVIRRPLSPVERWYWICDQLSPLNVISRVRVRGELPQELLRTALDALQAKHPLLRLAIAHDQGRNPRWEPTELPIPLRHVICDGQDADDRWVREINGCELPVPVDWRTGPMIRALAITRAAGDHDLIITVPHCIADGTTVLSLAREWLELAACFAVGQWPTEGAMRVLPPPDELLPPEYQGSLGQQRLVEQTRRDELTMNRHRPGRVQPTERIPLDQRRTRLLPRSLSGEQLDVLVKACRQEQTTVHGALAAAMVVAAARDAGEPPLAHFTIGSPIDFRGELVPQVSPREVGTYVATVPSVVDCRPEIPLWTTARAISADLVERRRLGDHFCLVNLVVGACPATVAEALPFMEFMAANGPINLCISNIGRYDFPDSIGPWQVSDAQFLTGISVNGYFVATINTSHGRLYWNFTYIADAVPDSRARRLADGCLNTLLSAVTEPIGTAR